MKTRNVIAVIVVLMICFIVAVNVFFTASTRAARQMARAVAEEFKQTFNAAPVITVNNRVIAAESRPISELATASKAFSVDTTFTSTWLHSTKYIAIRGEFLAKAGFDLNDHLKIDIRTDPKVVVVTLPPPKVLSIEMNSSEITDQKGGMVNWLSPQDHEDALKQLTDEARQAILKSSIMDAAKTEMEKRIRAIGALKDMPVTIQYEPGGLRLPQPKG